MTDDPSDVQIEDPGGDKTSEDGKVQVSKTINGTDIENVFDITLTVQVGEEIFDALTDPDMAVVVVMDISNTMKDNFGGVTRYAAAMEAAEDFLDKFVAENKSGVSKVGYVAFNTDAHKIFDLTSCSSATQANALKSTMRTATGNIINKDGYGSAHNRFTNIEGGLKLASDMLAKASNKHKYIILLTDGFPTTYVSSGYNGYDPYTSSGTIGADGVFYDSVLKVYCGSGTSYSDKAAIRAREMATKIKNAGMTIFSIGVDVGGQTVKKYVDDSYNLANPTDPKQDKISIVDRTSESYEIGDASSTDSYKNWLKNSIGSGYYYDSTNTAGLKAAYEQIFAQIRENNAQTTDADWVAADPLPVLGDTTKTTVEFIGFFNQGGTLLSTNQNLSGKHEENGEDTATYTDDNNQIDWDLKQSGYTKSATGGKTIYTYKVVYRVRLRNEEGAFKEGTVYDTNDTTTLRYRVIETNNGETTISDTKTIDFPIPSVHGYLGELTFTKVSNLVDSIPVPGAEFTLTHDTGKCSVCRGDGTSIGTIDQVTAISGTDGKVSFTKIPSGHVYTLEETGVPDGYHTSGEMYQVTVAYDEVTVTVTDKAGNTLDWNGKIVNQTTYALPETGGVGTWMYTTGGAALVALWILMYSNKRGRRRNGFH